MAMRNYGAMGNAKLSNAIRELQANHGPAYDRVLAQPLWPARSVEENLKIAMEVAASRGLVTDGALPQSPPAPVIPKCRGCAGTGVDHSVPLRVMQIADGQWNIGPKPDAKRFTTSVVTLGVGEQCLPLALLLPRFAKAQSEGREITRVGLGNVAFPLTDADACTWCHGTGEPQLSTHVLNERVETK